MQSKMLSLGMLHPCMCAVKSLANSKGSMPLMIQWIAMRTVLPADNLRRPAVFPAVHLCLPLRGHALVPAVHWRRVRAVHEAGSAVLRMEGWLGAANVTERRI